MTTPTPRVFNTEAEWIHYLVEQSALADKLQRDLAARDASLRYVRETLDKALPGMDEGAPIEAIARKVAAHIAARDAELAAMKQRAENMANWGHQEAALRDVAERERDSLSALSALHAKERDEARRDAMRYRWLRNEAMKDEGEAEVLFLDLNEDGSSETYYQQSALEMDAAIDAAIAAKGEA